MDLADPVIFYPFKIRPFIEAVFANRSDDSPILILADWLEENGHENKANYFRENIKSARNLCLYDSFGYWLEAKNLDYLTKKLPPQVPAAGVYHDVDYKPIV